MSLDIATACRPHVLEDGARGGSAAVLSSTSNARRLFETSRAALSAPRSAQIDAARNDVAFEQMALFRGLTSDQRSEIIRRGWERQAAHRQVLFREGDAACNVRLLCAGRVKMTQLSAGGAEVILNLHGPGDLVGEVGHATAAVHSSSAHALETCRMLIWDALVFEQLFERIPRLRRNVMALLATRLRGIEERFRELATEQVAARIARMLLRLADAGGPGANGTVCIPLSREELAQMTGTTVFTASRLLSEWKQQGIIGARRHAVLVRRSSGLMHLAGIGDRGPLLSAQAPSLALRVASGF